MQSIKERPISFNTEMVQAILDGRKTQTRRPVKRLNGFGDITNFGKSEIQGFDWTFRDKRMLWNDLSHEELLIACPYGTAGDSLWGREKWCQQWRRDPLGGTFVKARYFADGYIPQPGMFFQEPEEMPRWASRITLEITSIRIQELRNITEQDILDEGVNDASIESYMSLWKSIYGPDSWEQNPFVWVIEFRRI